MDEETPVPIIIGSQQQYRLGMQKEFCILFAYRLRALNCMHARVSGTLNSFSLSVSLNFYVHREHKSSIITVAIANGNNKLGCNFSFDFSFKGSSVCQFWARKFTICIHLMHHDSTFDSKKNTVKMQ